MTFYSQTQAEAIIMKENATKLL